MVKIVAQANLDGLKEDYSVSGNTPTLVLYFVVFFGIMYFLMIRPQQKQQKQRQAMLSSLHVNDKVVTTGGIYGKITKVKEKTIMLKVADKVEIEVAKAGIGSVENREAALEKNQKEDAKEDKKDKPAEIEAEHSETSEG